MELQISNLSKTYPNGVQALQQISMSIQAGMFGLLGPNGAGKSTLMRTIATLQQPDSGELHLGDIDIKRQPMEIRYQLGYLPQSFGVYPRMSADQLLHYLARLKGIASRKDRQRMIDYCLEVTNLTEARRKHVSSYSGGMKQRFGIAQLLLNQPKLIIVDEPTAGLDPGERQRFLNILRDISTENIVIFSTHIVDDIKDLCTDMAILNRGKLMLRAAPEEAMQSLAGQVWTTNIGRTELPTYQQNYQVLSSAFNRDNSLRIRVHSQQQPAAEFQAVAPKLEDVYFAVLGGQHQGDGIPDG
ncbi:MAG: ABC transporter ATP-binding protein [Bacteroidota bacterium]